VIGEHTYRQVSDHFACRELDRIRVKGKHQPVIVYELMDAEIARPKYRLLLNGFENAMSAFPPETPAPHGHTTLSLISQYGMSISKAESGSS